MEKLFVDKNLAMDAVNIASGAYAPLLGFLRKEDFLSVLDRMRLSNGAVWSMPIVLDIDEADYHRLIGERSLLLYNDDLGFEAVLYDIEIYEYDSDTYAQKVFGTLDPAHPGVQDLYQKKKYLLGGDIKHLEIEKLECQDYNLTPVQVKKVFKELGWKTVVAFQTRNVPHLGHEFLQKHALQNVDGLLIQPVIGEKKSGDFHNEIIVGAYEILIDKFFKKNSAMLSVLPLKMRYAGPREAVMHALIRRNFGCTHFIVGRDHAGVGDYYAPTAAQEIFDNFQDNIDIQILKYPEIVYNKKTEKHDFLDKVEMEHRLNFSGTQIREFISQNKKPPEHLLRPEVFEFLRGKDCFIN